METNFVFTATLDTTPAQVLSYNSLKSRLDKKPFESVNIGHLVRILDEKTLGGIWPVGIKKNNFTARMEQSDCAEQN